ncbi:MAG: hypothetical protein RI900_2253, partial [Actinomycetota bacterium]
MRPARDRGPLRHPLNPYGTAKAITDDEVAHIHETALGLLQQQGVRVLLPEARSLFAAAGAEVDDETMMVRLDVELTRALLSTAPAEFTLHARDPECSMRIGGQHVAFFPVAGPPYAADRVGGRRAGTLSDFQRFTRLVQRSDV